MMYVVILEYKEVGCDFQDYIDSMEGATLSGRQAAAYICRAGDDLAALKNKEDLVAVNS